MDLRIFCSIGKSQCSLRDMEHLPLADGADAPQLSVPFVVKARRQQPYSGDDNFLSFPQRHLDELRLTRTRLSAHDCLLSLAQSWLFFGTLAEFFQQPIKSATFTKADENGQAIIQTSALPAYRTRWAAFLPWRLLINAGFRQREARRLSVLLARACWAYEVIKELLGEEPCTRRVMFSIKITLCSLCHTVQTVLFPTPTLKAAVSRLSFHPTITEADGSTKETDFLLWDYMVQNGWCPHQINHLLNLHNATSMVYLASLQRDKRHINHEKCLDDNYCKASQVDWANFEPPHVSSGCTCKHVSVNEEDIMMHLENNRIPLLSCVRTSSGDFDVKVIPADIHTVLGRPTFYYAISHVWADGLGNPVSNSLPKCQFELLYRKLSVLTKAVSKTRASPFNNALPGSTAWDERKPIVFWMDVFCVPVQKSNSDRHTLLKEQAIRLMDLTYSCARQVLVLDSEMNLTVGRMGPSADADHMHEFKASTEELCRFATSRWMGRSWTLQEGALASELWAHYANRPVPARSFYASTFPPSLVDKAPPELFALRQALEPQVSLPSVGRGTQDLTAAAAWCSSAREVQFLEVWNSLIGRSTTQPEDFHCIVANLLDYSAFALKGYDSQARMRAIILSQKRLPLQLFCFSGRKGPAADKTMEWLPEKPIEPRLPDDAFACSVKVKLGRFDLEPACLPFCFYTSPPQDSRRSFCLGLPSTDIVHPHLLLDLPQDTVLEENAQLLVYLNVSTQTHRLVADYRRNGAAFVVLNRQKSLLELKYLCSVKFWDCWEVHELEGEQTPSEPVSRTAKVSIAGPETRYMLRFRRPLRVGANLIATLPAKAILAIALIYLITSLLVVVMVASISGGSLGSVILFPSGRKFLLLPVIIYIVLLFYATITLVVLYYMSFVALISARYISTPWVQQSYLTDHLAWYVRVLYWDGLPSVNGFVMWMRRFHQSSFVQPIFYRATPYKLQQAEDDWLGLIKRLWVQVVLSRWRQKHSLETPLQNYLDDSGNELSATLNDDTVLHQGYHQTQEPQIAQSLASSDHWAAQAFDQEQLGEHNVQKLTMMQRGLMATKTDGTSLKTWDLFLDFMAAFLWIGRIEKQRSMWEILFDMGLTRGRA